MPGPSDDWASASDLAEYAYCPRAWYYRTHEPARPVSSAARRASAAGERYHRSTLATEERRERHVTGYLAALLVAVLLILGGILWAFH
jgi:CRISPR/Cas system-associated exonuclease Cas4 (RecB family)